MNTIYEGQFLGFDQERQFTVHNTTKKLNTLRSTETLVPRDNMKSEFGMPKFWGNKNLNYMCKILWHYYGKTILRCYPSLTCWNQTKIKCPQLHAGFYGVHMSCSNPCITCKSCLKINLEFLLTLLTVLQLLTWPLHKQFWRITYGYLLKASELKIHGKALQYKCTDRRKSLRCTHL